VHFFLSERRPLATCIVAGTFQIPECAESSLDLSLVKSGNPRTSTYSFSSLHRHTTDIARFAIMATPIEYAREVLGLKCDSNIKFKGVEFDDNDLLDIAGKALEATASLNMRLTINSNKAQQRSLCGRSSPRPAGRGGREREEASHRAPQEVK
jgi:hypothetical protein